MVKVYVYALIQANGINILCDNIEMQCKSQGIEYERITTLVGRKKTDCIIPIGVKEAYLLMKAGFQSKIAFLVDAITLGYWNKIKFYLNQCHIFHYDFFYTIYAYLKYIRREKAVLKAYDEVALVSYHDIEYLKTLVKKPKSKFYCVQNGAYFEEKIAPRTQADHFRLGILSPWGTKMTSEESIWFVKDYYAKFAKSHPKVKLYIAGRGPYIEKMRGIQNVEILGEVPSLNDFFANLDVFLAVNPKGCGVLNRVLDALAHKTPVLALPASMTGFAYADGNYVPFTDYESFEREVINMMANKEKMDEMAERAYQLLCENNNWDKNYSQFLQEILKLY